MGGSSAGSMGGFQDPTARRYGAARMPQRRAMPQRSFFQSMPSYGGGSASRGSWYQPPMPQAQPGMAVAQVMPQPRWVPQDLEAGPGFGRPGLPLPTPYQPAPIPSPFQPPLTAPVAPQPAPQPGQPGLPPMPPYPPAVENPWERELELGFER